MPATGAMPGAKGQGKCRANFVQFFDRRNFVSKTSTKENPNIYLGRHATPPRTTRAAARRSARGPKGAMR